MSGKVWTKTQLLAKTAKDGDCRIWKGAYTTNGDPFVFHEDKRVPTRRLLLILSGVEVPEGHFAGRVLECPNKGCICQEHATVRSSDEHMRAATARKTETAASLANRRIAARRRAKLTNLQADAIRAQEGTLKEIGDQYGISLQTVWRIKRGIMWKEGASLFSGLLR